jgi:Helicase conserved C-terminal domain/Type III restriction enzyme, res subunit
MNHEILYPSLDDPLFNLKISNKKEFSDTAYDGTIYVSEERATELCEAPVFQLAPHQAFVRNFLSSQTPYNSLLLYHGVGSGKTCAAITISEEYREYMKQMGIQKKIYIIASDVVQSNYRLQLFNESNLKQINGLWSISGCIGNKFLMEINPMNLTGLSKEQVVNEINKIIDKYYDFFGYHEFGNYIDNKFFSEVEHIENKKRKEKQLTYLLQSKFENCLIIVDEVHNLVTNEAQKASSKNEDALDNKVTAIRLLKMLKYVNIKLLLLSATPMYHDIDEIVVLLQLLNQNDKRPIPKKRDIFLPTGEFKENGKEILLEKSRGYISVVRSENPYTFPYRIFPSMIEDKKHVEFKEYLGMNENARPIQHIDIYTVTLKGYQKQIYNEYVETIKHKSLNINDLRPPIQLLNIVYPNDEKNYGEEGLRSIMNYIDDKYEYKSNVPHIFNPDELPNYSSKMTTICDKIINSTGIVLIYSFYIQAGAIPMALALESLGFSRYEGSIMNKKKVIPLDSLTMKPDPYTKNQAKYTIISGNAKYSPSKNEMIKIATNQDNKYGKNIKVIIVTESGAEGIDLKNIRQIHIMDPWYNMNRNEQIIGRGVRNCSHKDLPFSERNCEIYLYASNSGNGIETADYYFYRLAEIRAMNLGKVARILKESAIDCILNQDQLNFTEENMNQIVKQKLSSGKIIDYAIGDKPYSATCDYLSSCTYECKPDNQKLKENVDTYNSYYLKLNNTRLTTSIQLLFKKRYVYSACEILAELNVVNKYSDLQIYSAISEMIDMKVPIYDLLGREGTLIKMNEYFMFQPKELMNKEIPTYYRTTPIPKHISHLRLEIPDTIKKEELIDVEEIIEDLNKQFKEKHKYVNHLFNLFGIHNKHVNELIIDSIMERLNFTNFKSILEYILNLDTMNTFDYHIEKYIKKTMKKNRILTLKDNKPYILFLDNHMWNMQMESDLIEMEDVIREMKKPKDLNQIIGFIANKSLKTDMVFKTLTLKSNSRNTGETCDDSQRKAAREKLEEVLGHKMSIIEEKHRIKIHREEICMMLEFVLRNYDKINYFGKRCFLSPVEYIYFLESKKASS